jgi:hypothetical protein
MQLRSSVLKGREIASGQKGQIKVYSLLLTILIFAARKDTISSVEFRPPPLFKQLAHFKF